MDAEHGHIYAFRRIFCKKSEDVFTTKRSGKCSVNVMYAMLLIYVMSGSNSNAIHKTRFNIFGMTEVSHIPTRLIVTKVECDILDISVVIYCRKICNVTTPTPMLIHNVQCNLHRTGQQLIIKERVMMAA